MLTQQEGDAHEASDEPIEYRFKRAETIDDVNHNFSQIGDALTLMAKEFSAQNENVNRNLLTLAEQTSSNINLLSTQIKSVISAHTMGVLIFLIVVACGVASVSAIYSAFTAPIHP